MSALVRYEVRDGVAVVTVDNPPVNALSAGVPEGISEAVARACHDSAADAIVLIGADRTFIADADINVFKQLKTREQSIERSQVVHTRLKCLEDADEPLVAAIHGHALGGGLEFAVACHYRVAVATARLGQPEVHLGIIPGAGGTQRLPRLCGPVLALEMCTGGQPVTAAQAEQAGIVDAVIDGDLLEGAIAFAQARAAAREHRRTRDLQDRISDRAAGIAACQGVRATVGKAARGARAPFAAVDAVESCFTMDFDAGSRREIDMREAYLLLEEGASVSQIDNALTDFGYPVGPFGMQDIAGIDVGWRIRQHLKSAGKTRAEGPQSAVPDRLYELGRYGQKTGAGWYRYEPGSRTRIPDALVEDVAAEAAAARGVTRRAVTDEEIIARIMTALANEGARVLEEGFATRASDVVYVHGFGFPRHRGGPMFYADTVGLSTVVARVKTYRQRFGDYWQPSSLLERMAIEGRAFHGGAA